ncbi:4a-hydroxytetrahydrobiopterin dehydratase [Pedococcus sp. KACC 23699]|uniref:Putative pterin-4-alpha-carbinolamine dehydratase n=1 Tax=Pedococcus sp. KACC 23699 TaxID=3149228 RepID=A0AAU7JPZ6_9MICO
MSRLLTHEELDRQLDDLPGWAVVGTQLEATFEAPDFPSAIRLVDEVALEAESMNHHPDIDIRWRAVKFVLSTHDLGGLSQLDVELAHQISQASNRIGAQARG